jgi:hypothetical protein
MIGYRMAPTAFGWYIVLGTSKKLGSGDERGI